MTSTLYGRGGAPFLSLFFLPGFLPLSRLIAAKSPSGGRSSGGSGSGSGSGIGPKESATSSQNSVHLHICIVIAQSGSITVSQTAGRIISLFGPIKS